VIRSIANDALRALLLQAFYGVRSERQLMERLDFDLLFRWFVGLGVDDPVWDASTFSKDRDRLLEGDAAATFLAAIVAHPKVRRLTSTEHFSVDGTLIEAWASMKSFKPKLDGGEPPNDDARHPGSGAMPRWTSAASGARTRRMPRPPTRTPDCSARAAGPGPCSASWDTR
jgi:IS5 family transposase